MSRIITTAALQGRSLAQLQAMYQTAQQELVRSEHGSRERSEVLASLELISLAIAQKHSMSRLRGPGF